MAGCGVPSFSPSFLDLCVCLSVCLTRHSLSRSNARGEGGGGSGGRGNVMCHIRMFRLGSTGFCSSSSMLKVPIKGLPDVVNFRCQDSPQTSAFTSEIRDPF